MPWPTTKPPLPAAPSRTSASSFSSTHRDVPALGGEPLGDRGADAPAPDDDGLHGARTAYSSKTPSGNATTSTSQGAWRRTKSTVGEKKRDCRRQRGDEPRTIRSAPRARASSTIAWPIERARTTSRADLDAVILAEQPRLVERRVDRAATSAGSSPSSSNLRGTRTTVIASIVGAALLRERDRRRDHLLADVAELHRHEDPLELRARRELLDRVDVLEQAALAAPPDDDEHDRARRSSHTGPGVARAGMRDHREHPDRRTSAARRRAPAAGRGTPRIRTFGPREKRPLELGLASCAAG